MRKLLVIGIGVGSPDHVTVGAIAAMNRTDVFFLPDKGAEKAALRQVRQDILHRFVQRPAARTVEFPVPRRDPAGEGGDGGEGGRGAYLAGVDAWHGRLAEDYARMITDHLPDGQTGAFLVWGDPALYDSTLRIVDRLAAAGLALAVEVIPGLSTPQVLAARHRITLNRIGEPVTITTGRKLAEAGAAPDVVVMLDGVGSYRNVAGDPDIYWGAYLGTPDELLVAGKLSEVAGEIERLRSEGKRRHGWIMDTYLLRRA